jgi:hypothetical protein
LALKLSASVQTDHRFARLPDRFLDPFLFPLQVCREEPIPSFRCRLSCRNVSSQLSLRDEMRTAQQTLSEFAAHGVCAEAAPAGESDVAVFLASLSSAWKEGEARPTHRKQPKAKHWWRSRVDPFADAWPLIEGWLIAEPSVSANVLMDRLATMFPEAYASQAQLRTLQRRVKAWRAERVKELILGGLRKSADAPAEV